MTHSYDRRTALAGLGATGLVAISPSPAMAQGLNLGSILGRATDSALDRLAQPGAFYNDEDVRIGLPMLGNLGSGGSSGGFLGRALGAASRLGGLPGIDDIIRGINDAAGEAAGLAKPIFRDAINGLSFGDAPGIIREDDGGTQYLRRSSNDRLTSEFNPLVDTALTKAGLHDRIDGLASKNSLLRDAGLNRENINASVTEQGLDGIFSYIGAEERNFRKNPLRGLGNLLRN
ncbi:hypothetical protein EH30_11645 [Erythrobacter sp. JL475]|nr:hypothetical protein EH30_11645 [Erythrobacter sp. JL475]